MRCAAVVGIATILIWSSLPASAAAGDVNLLKALAKTDAESICAVKASRQATSGAEEDCDSSNEWGGTSLLMRPGMTKLSIRAVAADETVGTFVIANIEIDASDDGYFTVQERRHPNGDKHGPRRTTEVGKLYRGRMTKNEIAEIVGSLDKSDFWNLAQFTDAGNCASNETWTIEAVKYDRRNIVSQYLACDSKTGVGPVSTAIKAMLASKPIPKQLQDY